MKLLSERLRLLPVMVSERLRLVPELVPERLRRFRVPLLSERLRLLSEMFSERLRMLPVILLFPFPPVLYCDFVSPLHFRVLLLSSPSFSPHLSVLPPSLRASALPRTGSRLVAVPAWAPP